MLHIYWGLGRGKTSAVNGTAVRAIGSKEWKPVIARFLKGRDTSEDDLLRSLDIKVIRNQTSENFVTFMKDEAEVEESKKQNLDTFDQLLKLKDEGYNYFVLDEIIDLVGTNVGFLTEDELVEFIKKLEPEKNEVLCTGHQELPKLWEVANLITTMTPTKHYYNEGVANRKGIEN